MVLLLLLELGFRAVVAGWNESGSSEARNAFSLPVSEINVYRDDYLNKCMFLSVFLDKTSFHSNRTWDLSQTVWPCLVSGSHAAGKCATPVHSKSGYLLITV